jgi:hypothetical protein
MASYWAGGSVSKSLARQAWGKKPVCQRSTTLREMLDLMASQPHWTGELQVQRETLTLQIRQKAAEETQESKNRAWALSSTHSCALMAAVCSNMLFRMRNVPMGSCVLMLGSHLGLTLTERNITIFFPLDNCNRTGEAWDPWLTWSSQTFYRWETM